MNDYMTLQEAALYLGVGKSRISQLLSTGVLQGTLIGGRRMVSCESVKQYNVMRKDPGRPGLSSSKDVERFTLMNANHEIMRVAFHLTHDEPLSVIEVLDPRRAPLGVLTSGGLPIRRELNEWWRLRSIPATRPGIESKLLSLGLSDTSHLSLRSLGLSLSDSYWLRPEDAPHLTWESINLFQNDFIDSSMDDTAEWTSAIGLISPDNTSEGELPKRWIIAPDRTRLLLKGGSTDDQRPFNEVVATALAKRLLLPEDYVPYSPISTPQGPASACPTFVSAGEEFIPASTIRKREGNTRGANTYDRFCKTARNLGADEESCRTLLSKMIVFDAILSNSDRHWRNFGLIRNVDSLELRIAPIFDSGNCLWFNKITEELRQGDFRYISKPFSPEPGRQLAFADRLAWFEASALDGFAEEAIAILSDSAYATAAGRLDLIGKGLEQRISDVRAAVAVLRFAKEG